MVPLPSSISPLLTRIDISSSIKLWQLIGQGNIFYKLANEAVGLRELTIFWDAETELMHLGGGADVDAIRALRQIKGLNKLEISGYFATELPIRPAGRHTIATLCPPIDPKAYRFLSLSPTSRSMSPCSSSSTSCAAASSTGSTHAHPTVQSSRRSWRGICGRYEGVEEGGRSCSKACEVVVCQPGSLATTFAAAQPRGLHCSRPPSSDCHALGDVGVAASHCRKRWLEGIDVDSERPVQSNMGKGSTPPSVTILGPIVSHREEGVRM